MTNRDKNDREPKSSPARKRRIAARDNHALRFETLEDRRLLASVTVTNASDVTNADTSSITALIADNGGDGISLREAVEASNNTVGSDTISFDALLAAQTITLGGTDIEITESVTIDATSLTSHVTLNGNLQSRIFDITAATGDFTLTGLTLTGGRTATAAYSDSSQAGGAIRSLSSGNLTLDQTTVSGNGTAGNNSRGGGIYARGNISLTSSTVSGNSTAGNSADGGGIFTFGDATLTLSNIIGNSTVGGDGGGVAVSGGDVILNQSTVSENSTAVDVFGAGRGGGVSAPFGAVVLNQSTVSGNTTTGFLSRGGGINGGEVTLIQSTVSGNSTAGTAANGGGIAARNELTIIQSTVTDNHALNSGASGGGLRLFELSDRGIVISGSIVAGNTAGEGMANLDPTVNASTINYSIVGMDIAPITSTSSNNFQTDNPRLAPLANNGGPTQTHALLESSPAINAGRNELAVDLEGVPLATDQRSNGFARIQMGTVDVGAIESNFDAAIPPTVVSATINEGGVLTRPDLLNTLTVVFDQNVVVPAQALTLLQPAGSRLPVDLTGVGFSYDGVTSTAVWDFTALDPLKAGFYSYQLDAELIVSGNVSLDGDGDGIRGDDFQDQIYVAIPGDANLDGRVDVLNDAFTLVRNLNSTTNISWADGDFNRDGQVDILGDAFILIANLNRNVDFVSDVVITNNGDIVNGDTSSVFALIADNGGDGISLREAIAASDNTIGLGTITFNESVFNGGSTA